MGWRLVPSLALVLALSGCGATPVSPGRPVSATARLKSYTVDHDAWASLGYRYDWTGFPYVERGERVLYISTWDDVIAVLEGGSTVTVLDADTGRARWNRTVANRLTRFVGLARAGNELIAASDTELYLLSIETGDITGRHPLEKVANTAPVIAGDLAVYGTASGEITGHLLTIGLRIWGNVAGAAIDQTPVLLDNGFGAITRTGDLLFVDGRGSQLGRTRIYGGATTRPVGGGGLFFVASSDQSVYAFDPSGAVQVWRYRTEHPLTVQPTYLDGVLYCETLADGLVAFRSASGQVLWSNTEVRGTVVARRGNGLLVWDGSAAAAIDADSGEVLERVELPRIARLTADATDGGNLYAVTQNGLVLKFTPRP